MAKQTSSMLQEMAKALTPKKVDTRKFRLKKAMRMNAAQALQFAHAINVTAAASGKEPTFLEFIHSMAEYGFQVPTTPEDKEAAERTLGKYFSQEGPAITSETLA